MGKAGFAEDYLLVLSCWTLFFLEYKHVSRLNCSAYYYCFGEVWNERRKKLRGYKMENMQGKKQKKKDKNGPVK